MKTIFIGVTGHREICPDLLSGLIGQLDHFFCQVKSHHPGNQIILQSPLAEGADRLAARIAIAHGISLVVPLPLEKEDYIQDFNSDSSKEEFHSLCEQAENISVPVPPYSVQTRTDAYLAVGSYVALTSHYLLALWDLDIKHEKPGGTACIVRLQMEGFPDSIACHYPAIQQRKTYVIPAPRKARSETETTGRFWTCETYQNWKERSM